MVGYKKNSTEFDTVIENNYCTYNPLKELKTFSNYDLISSTDAIFIFELIFLFVSTYPFITFWLGCVATTPFNV
jgi:hypothetical protein